MERRWLMIAADVIRCAATAVGAALAITHHLTLLELGAVVALGGFGQALFAPAFGSIVPELVPVELLPQANSLDMFVRTSAGLVGPAIGGVVIATVGAGWAFAIDSATFVGSTCTALALTPRPFEQADERRHAWREARAGFGYVRRHTWLWATLLAGALANLASGTRNVLLSSFAFGQHGLPRRPVLVAYVGWTFAIGPSRSSTLPGPCPSCSPWASSAGSGWPSGTRSGGR
jgi:MFS family permease